MVPNWVPIQVNMSGSPGGLGSAVLHLRGQERKPLGWVISDVAADVVQEGDVVGRGREHRHEVLQTGEVELADGAAVPLLDEEAPAALGAEAAHDRVFRFAEAEALDVLLANRLRISQ